MGASQVFPALVVLALAKKRWPATVTVAGGSHTTLLADNIRKGLRAGTGIGSILPGHSEESFVELLQGTVSSPAGHASSVSAVARDFEYFPLFLESRSTCTGTATPHCRFSSPGGVLTLVARSVRTQPWSPFLRASILTARGRPSARWPPSTGFVHSPSRIRSSRFRCWSPSLVRFSRRGPLRCAGARPPK